jgi:hypothetical protein
MYIVNKNIFKQQVYFKDYSLFLNLIKTLLLIAMILIYLFHETNIKFSVFSNFLLM